MFRFSALFLAVAFFSTVAFVFCVPTTSEDLQKRASGRGTWFDVGLGACGKTSVNSDKIVALPAADYAGGRYCNKKITIRANGKVATATVLDLCPGCAPGDLDMSPSLFQKFASLDKGVVSINWSFN